VKGEYPLSFYIEIEIASSLTLLAMTFWCVIAMTEKQIGKESGKEKYYFN
jgi:hypothetical protein